MARLPHRFDERCPCRQDCPRRSVGCRSSCEAFSQYEAIKHSEYAEHLRKVEEAYLRNALTAAAIGRKKKSERDRREGRL